MRLYSMLKIPAEYDTYTLLAELGEFLTKFLPSLLLGLSAGILPESSVG
jgi:hypothetical protein